MNTLKNRVQLIGNLGTDPVVKEVSNGTSLARFSLATNEEYMNPEGEKVNNTQWHNLVAWGNMARIVRQYLKKGNKVTIEGKLANRTYETQTGIRRFITEVIVTGIVLAD
ncbi:MAG: single-stranded DNA-binding protein [Bacteroidetes bacterium]|nr:single-stranded DNA-binding protein [Bacteroidota bacterium]